MILFFGVIGPTRKTGITQFFQKANDSLDLFGSESPRDTQRNNQT